MSNWHGLRMSRHEHWIEIAFHIAVPDENNSAGVNLRIALKQYLENESESGIITSQVPFITTGPSGELTDLQNGELYEVVETIEFNKNLTLVEKRTIVDSRYTALSSAVPNKIRSMLKFWGMDREVP